jgi:hypothetical protein
MASEAFLFTVRVFIDLYFSRKPRISSQRWRKQASGSYLDGFERRRSLFIAQAAPSSKKMQSRLAAVLLLAAATAQKMTADIVSCPG